MITLLNQLRDFVFSECPLDDFQLGLIRNFRIVRVLFDDNILLVELSQVNNSVFAVRGNNFDIQWLLLIFVTFNIGSQSDRISCFSFKFFLN